jgi:hypothetical protein
MEKVHFYKNFSLFEGQQVISLDDEPLVITDALALHSAQSAFFVATKQGTTLQTPASDMTSR